MQVRGVTRASPVGKIGWQTRPHDGLVGPDSGRTLSSNEMYAVMVSAAGYVPVMLASEGYLSLLPATWRTINEYGVRIDRRTYNADALNPLRRRHSGIATQNRKWKVRFDPYDLSQIWVRDHRAPDKRFCAVSTHPPMVSAPFADFTWRHARQRTAAATAGAGRRPQPRPPPATEPMRILTASGASSAVEASTRTTAAVRIVPRRSGYRGGS